jgi:dienelactone hydrolase
MDAGNRIRVGRSPRRGGRRATALVSVMALALAGLVMLASEPAGAADVASSSLGTFSGTTAAMVDGNLATAWKGFGTPSTSDWVRIDKGAVVPVGRVDLYMTDAGSPGDRINTGVIERSTNGTTWTSLGTFANTNEVHLATPAGTTARYVRARPTAGQLPWLVVRELSAVAGTPATPPGQPASGPGGSTYPHAGVTVSQGGAGNDAWYVFQPASPKPAAAPVAIMLHGYGELAGYSAMQNLITHTVRKGYVVIYPRWQTGLGNPLGIEATMTSAKNGIVGARTWLQADPTRVQPQLDRVSYFGWSYGGIIATNLANRQASLGLPVPKALMLVEPHDGSSEAELDDTLTGLPATMPLTCYISDDWPFANPSGCSTIFGAIATHIPNEKKDYVVYYDDAHGVQPMIANHQSVCSPPAGAPVNDACGPAPDQFRTDALDYFAFWKSWVGLQRCANDGLDCAYALGDTAEHRNMGLWSDGVPIRPLRITDAPAAP